MLPAAEVPRARSSFLARAGLLLLTVSLFGCDHATKIAAEASLSQGRAVDVLSGVLELRYVENHDTAFSLLQNLGLPRSPNILLAASAIALVSVVVAWIASRKRATRAQHVGFALVLAGALGNVVDRAIRGFVVDFIHVTRWPVFNVADIAVVAGMLLLVFAALRRREETPPAAGPPGAPHAPA